MASPLPYEQENKQRSLAAVMHLAAIPFAIVAPVVGIVVSKPNSFLRTHSIVRLKREIWTAVILFVIGAIYFLSSVPGWIHHFQTGFRDFDILQFLLKTAIYWVLTALYGVWNTLEGVILAVRAFNGNEPKTRQKAPATP
jgi:hypothetical protein